MALNRLAAAAVAAMMLVSLTSEAQLSGTARDARSGAMGGCYLTDDTTRRVSVDYRQAFMLAAMADKGLTLLWPTARFGTIDAAYRYHGNADYHEQEAAVGYGLRVAPWLKVAVEARYVYAGTADAYYEPRHWLAGGAAVTASLGRRVDVTVAAGSRPWAAEKPWKARLQIASRPMVSILTVVEADWEERLRWRLGMEYSYRGMVYARAGLATNPAVATFGVGVKWRGLGVDLGAEVHRALGITPQTSLTLWF